MSLKKSLILILLLISLSSCTKEIKTEADQGLIYIKNDGTRERIPASGSDQIILLNFWAPWCETCIKEIPGLRDFSIEKSNVQILFLSFKSENINEIKAKSKDLNINDSSGYIDKETMRFFFKDLNLALPTTLLIDKNYRTIKAWYGEISPQDIESFLSKTGEGKWFPLQPRN